MSQEAQRSAPDMGVGGMELACACGRRNAATQKKEKGWRRRAQKVELLVDGPGSLWVLVSTSGVGAFQLLVVPVPVPSLSLSLTVIELGRKSPSPSPSPVSSGTRTRTRACCWLLAAAGCCWLLQDAH